MNQPSRLRGIRGDLMNLVMIIVTAVVSFTLLFATSRAISGYRNMQDATQQYFHAQEDANSMRSASDDLTRFVRVYTVTGDYAWVEAFFHEVDEVQRREKALADIESMTDNEESIRYLTEALASSQSLEMLEYHAMRLVAQADGLDPAGLPQRIQAVVLSEEEVAMTPEQQRRAAQLMVFDEEYQKYKDTISADVDACLETLISAFRDIQTSSSSTLLVSLQRQQWLIAALLLVVFATAALTTLLVIWPIRRSVKYVQADQPMPVGGSSEVQFLAESYNAMHDRNRRKQDSLTFEATHDPLTGIYNRKAYEEALLTYNPTWLTLIWLDVDRFKQINDTHGHDVGDRVLQRVANALQHTFRSEDFVCRVGGDEFAVLMVHTGMDKRELIQRKMKQISDSLSQPDQYTPGLTISVGVAFGDNPNTTGNLFKDADIALYRTKEMGRDSIQFY